MHDQTTRHRHCRPHQAAILQAVVCGLLPCLFAISLALPASATAIPQRGALTLQPTPKAPDSAPMQQEEMQEDALKTRRWMLSAHGWAALGALVAMTGAIILQPDDNGGSAVHQGFAFAGAGLYYTAATLAILAPDARMCGLELRPERLKWHRRLAWIHVPAMLIGPILGIVAARQRVGGRRPSGIARLHGPVSTLGYAAFLASGVALVFEL